jgi:hypothetical protein
MNTIDLVWSRRPSVADVMQKAAGIIPISRLSPRDETPIAEPPTPIAQPKTPPPPPPPPPADPAGIVGGDTPGITPRVDPADAAQSAKNVAAPFAGQLANVASGKQIIGSLDVDSDSEALMAKGDYSPITGALPTKGVDQMPPAQLAGLMRAHMAIGRTQMLKDRLAGKRIFANPQYADDAKANLDYDAVGDVYRKQSDKYSPEQREEYRKALYPGLVAGELEEKGVGSASPAVISKEVVQNRAELDKSLKEVETNPDGTGFTDWFKESWGNVAVPAGLLLMLFGGDTGMMLGGLAVAAGGYDLYNRYNTLTNDPAAQMAISKFVKEGMTNKSLADIRENFGDRYAKSALDFMALSRYGFLSVVQGKYRDAGMKAYRAYNPGKSDKDVEAFGATLPGATPDKNDWMQDFTGKAWNAVKPSNWMAGTPAAAEAK